MSITFQAQPIIIQTKEGEATFDAMVAVGTGLAYHRRYHGQGKFLKIYDVTHIASSHIIHRGDCPSVKAVQRYIELLAGIIDWTQPLEALQQLDRQKMNRLTSNAYHQAIRETQDVEYAVAPVRMGETE